MRFLNREALLANAAEGLAELRADALAILERGIDAVEPEILVARSLSLEAGRLTVRGDPFVAGAGQEPLTLDLRGAEAVRCVAAGKAAPGMLRGLEAALRVDEGVVATGIPGASRLPWLAAGHPLPDERSCEAGERAVALARATGERDLLVLLLSGGASAMLEDPLVPLEDLRAATRALLEAGASIHELNAVRRKLSGVKGGRLALAARGRVLALLLSDCFEDHEATVGSGPAAPDATTHKDALAVLERLDLLGAVPRSVLELLREGAAGQRPETPKPGDAGLARAVNVVLGSNALAAHEAAAMGSELGYNAWRVREPLVGPAARAGWKLARLAQDVSLGKAPLRRPACIVQGGETTVDVRGATGRGGRNQEQCLAALHALRVEALVACMGTDGIDGPTPAAGALADPGSQERAASLGLDAREALARHDSHAFFAGLGDLLLTGPTGTNVADLSVVLVP